MRSHHLVLRLASLEMHRVTSVAFNYELPLPYSVTNTPRRGPNNFSRCTKQ